MTTLRYVPSSWGRYLATPGRRFHPSLLQFSLAVLLALSIACPVTDASPPTNHPSQSDIEAVYLFDFGKFVRWPAASTNDPMRVCVAGPQSFADGLQSVVASEQVNGRTLLVHRVMRGEDPVACSILFIDSSERDRASDLLAASAGKPILTVSDLPDFLDRGGMIEFLLIANRVRFSVNLTAAAHSNLSLSSELLKVAMSVRGTPAGGAQ